VKALQYTGSVANYAATMALGRLSRAAYWGPLSCVRLRDVPEPVPPGPDWAVVGTSLAGICGSDLHLVLQQTSPSVSAFTSFPFTMGHENVGRLVEVGPALGLEAPGGRPPEAERPGALAPGTRVVVDPLLPCEVRAIHPPCPPCRAGEYSRCQNWTEGALSPGMLLGSCRDAGGTWSPFFLAHKSQVFRVPDAVSDEAAVLTEPLAVALHAAARCGGEPQDAGGPPASAPCGLPSGPAGTREGSRAEESTALVVGGGIIGLLVLASLRFLGRRSRVVALVRHRHQAELAREFAADEVVMTGPHWEEELARLLGARLVSPLLGRPVPTTGAAAVFECAGTRSSLDTALRFAAPGGEVVLVGLAASPPGIDWSHVWRKELKIQGAFCYAWETVGGRRVRTFELALEMLADGMFPFEKLVTHRFRLEDYPRAFRTLTEKGLSRAVKAVFSFE